MEEVAVDDRHCPKLYAKFLAGLLATPMASVDHKATPLKNQKAMSQSPTSRTIKLHAKAMEPRSITLPGRTTSSNPPSARPSASPPPVHRDENGHLDEHAHQLPALTNELPNGFSNYFTPLPLEPEFLQSMQTTGDQTGWQDMVVPGMFSVRCMIRWDLLNDFQALTGCNLTTQKWTCLICTCP